MLDVKLRKRRKMHWKFSASPFSKNFQQRLSSMIKNCILKFFGHVSRRNNDSVESIERLVSQGRVEGTTLRGRTDHIIKSAVSGPSYDCTRKSTNIERWWDIVRRVTSTLDQHDPWWPRQLCQECNEKEEEFLDAECTTLLLKQNNNIIFWSNRSFLKTKITTF